MAESSTTKTDSQIWRLELILESGKALEPPPSTRRLSLGRRMRTYAVVWSHPDVKGVTQIDKQGGPNPNWNSNKFGFRVKNQNEMQMFTINIEIYSAAVGLMMKNCLIGKTCLKVKVIPDKGPTIPGNLCNLEIKRPAAKGKAKAKAKAAKAKAEAEAEAELVHGGWINTRINVAPYQEPPPPPKSKESDDEAAAAAAAALGMMSLSLGLSMGSMI